MTLPRRVVGPVIVGALLSGCGVLGIGATGGGVEEFGMTKSELAQRVDDVEAEIGTCMAQEGFEYLPVDFASFRRAMTSDKSAPGLSGSEFTTTYGFGISTQIDKPIVTRSLGEDNARHVGTLNDADRVAFMRALLGSEPDATFAHALEQEDFSRIGGCTRTAVELQFEAAEMLATYTNPADVAIDADPRMRDALIEYESCMNAAGYAYSHPDEVEADLWARHDALTGDRSHEELAADGSSELIELQQMELALAPVALRCEVQIVEPVADRVESELFG